MSWNIYKSLSRPVSVGISACFVNANMYEDADMSRDDLLKAEMIDAIHLGGAWFTTRDNCFIKIGSSGNEDLMYARVCIIEAESKSAAADNALRGGAYTFGTDWFDISFHGRLIDIYVDPDTLKTWDIRYDEEHGTYMSPGNGLIKDGSLVEFCRQADQEVLSGAVNGGIKAYQIDGAGFAKELPPSEKKMGRTKRIFTL